MYTTIILIYGLRCHGNRCENATRLMDPILGIANNELGEYGVFDPGNGRD